MKKIITLFLILIFCLTLFTGCNESIGYNHQILDLNYKFNYAFVELPTGEIVKGPVSKWGDFEDGDMIQVVFTDGNIYYSHGSNIILIYDPNLEG